MLSYTRKSMLRPLIFAILCQLLYAIPAHTQSFDEKDFVLYTSKDGLSDNRINGVLQDRYGYLWIATSKGLNRFDGNNFLQFYSDTSSNSLANDHIKQLKWLGPDQLGCITATGLHLIQTGSLQQRNILIPPGPLDLPYIVNNIHGAASDKHGNLFILTSTGFYHYNANDELVFRYDHYKKVDASRLGVPFGRSDGLISPEPGLLLLATTAGPYIYYVAGKELHAIGDHDATLYRRIAPDSGLVHFMHCNNGSFSVIAEGATELAWFDLIKKKKEELRSSIPKPDEWFNWRSRIIPVNDSLFIISTMQKGFFQMKVDKVRGIYQILPKLYLPDYLCTSFLVDSRNRLWIATDRGLLRQRKNAGNLSKTIIPPEQNLSGSPIGIRSIASTGNKLFVGTAGSGIFVFEKYNHRFLHRIDLSQAHPTGSANYIHTLLDPGGDSIYAATFGPLFGISKYNYGYRKIPLPKWDDGHNWVSWQLLASDNTIYCGSNQNSLFYFRQAGRQQFGIADFTNQPLFNILAPMNISEDPQGHIWFGGHGASRFNPITHSFDMLIDSFPVIKTARKEICAMTFGKDGRIYFAVMESGLAIYDPVHKTFEHITRSNGLPDNTIRALYLFKNKLWMGTESGLASYDIITKKIAAFGIADGMPEGPFTSWQFYFDTTTHKLYGGFLNTLISFNPDSFEKDHCPPSFFIERLDIAGEQTIFHPQGTISIPYNQNSFVVNLAAVNFEDAHRQQFAYRFVKEGEETWQQTGSQRNIIFNNLPPGIHRLQLKIFIKNNSWREQIRELTIRINPPFWQTWWFILSAIMLLVSATWLLVRARIRNIKQKAAINTQLAELEMKGLHAQMNPHFIFNCLNSIKEMILQNEKKHASRYLSKFAQLIRINLEQSRQTFITVRQCIDQLQLYLDMERIRLDRFVYNISISEELEVDLIQMSPMLMQPLVENAIWHGLHPLQGEKELWIRFYSAGPNLICEVEDNGIGIVRSKQQKLEQRPDHQSFGLSNVRERLNVLNEKYKMKCSLAIIDKESTGKNGKGTLAKLELTILNHSV